MTLDYFRPRLILDQYLAQVCKPTIPYLFLCPYISQVCLVSSCYRGLYLVVTLQIYSDFTKLNLTFAHYDGTTLSQLFNGF